ncbi:unnamed protein product (macronuclear) [Paramecium tetraurelia]|uniref:RanBP2-type domain-containing protein n=1 Tax=Paramecium tetraurelia TaxID=5888 RepID=A0E226_PARTE|nr:uncharacterized protein GSPATT00022514001 [Paramecium tetraurelia]CAK89343.1 unnamed protein product [Paramecium tetraurelia]|eukprot:XP_001456740.1 hypothetical protein (macronuclear) [Paramecium tetraurelia strain d4-2]
MAQQKGKNKINHRQRQGDWICGSCNNMNFAFRDTCNRCHTLKNYKDNENKGFKSALFLTESNGDIPPISDRSNKSSGEKKDNGNNKFSFDKLPSMEPILKQITKETCKKQLNQKNKNMIYLSLNGSAKNAKRLINTIKFTVLNAELKGTENQQYDFITQMGVFFDKNALNSLLFNLNFRRGLNKDKTIQQINYFLLYQQNLTVKIMKDMSKKIFEKENQAEVSNNPRHQNKSLTQLVSLSLIGGNRKNDLKALELKNNYTSISSHPLVFCKPETKLKTQTTSSPQKQSPVKPKQVETQSNELCKLINNYSEPILDYYLELNTLTPKNCLSNHTVSANLRAKMIDWMVEVLTSYKCKDQTFFLAVKLMDSYLSKTTQKHIPQDLHLVGVTTMFMACKFEEIYPVKLQIVHEKIAHKKLTKDEIKDKETNILSTLDFNLVGITVLDVITIVLSILNMNQQLYQITLYLAKLALYDYEFVNSHTYAQIACAALIVRLQDCRAN